MYKSHGNTKQKSIVNTEKVEGREKKRTTKERYQTTKKESNYRNIQKALTK